MIIDKLQQATTIPEKIAVLKNERVLPDVKKFNSEYIVKEHEIFTNLSKYPDKTIENETIVNGVKTITTGIRPLVRVGLPYQKNIVKMATTFMFGNAVTYSNDVEDSLLFDAFKLVLDKNKAEFIDRDIETFVGRFTECVELWFLTQEENEYFGFPSKTRLKVEILSPDVYSFYPIFDMNGDMIFFSREFKSGDDTIFETYTDDVIVTYRETKTGWVLEETKANVIGKIPIVYHNRDQVEWADVQTAIDRLERIYSNVGESNDSFAYPILALTGKVEGSFSKNNSGRVLQLGDNASAKFVDQPNGNENINGEVQRLERDIEYFTSTPKITPSNLEGLGNMLSGAGAEFLFLSAHLKVRDKLSQYIPNLQRRMSLIVSFLKFMNVRFANLELEVTPTIKPFVVNDHAEFMRFLMEINGNKPLYSQAYAMELAGVKDPEQMIEEILNEDLKDTELNNSKEFGL